MPQRDSLTAEDQPTAIDDCGSNAERRCSPRRTFCQRCKPCCASSRDVEDVRELAEAKQLHRLAQIAWRFGFNPDAALRDRDAP